MNINFPNSRPAFGGQPAFKSINYTLEDPFLTFNIFFFILMEKDGFNQQMACKAPVCWSKHTITMYHVPQIVLTLKKGHGHTFIAIIVKILIDVLLNVKKVKN